MKTRYKKLTDYIDFILYKNHSVEEWQIIDKEIIEVFKTATEDEKYEFVCSGAGEVLEDTLEAINGGIYIGY